MVCLHPKNNRFWSHKNGWKRPQVSLKISDGVTQTAVGCLAALFAGIMKNQEQNKEHFEIFWLWSRGNEPKSSPAE